MPQATDSSLWMAEWTLSWFRQLSTGTMIVQIRWGCTGITSEVLDLKRTVLSYLWVHIDNCKRQRHISSIEDSIAVRSDDLLLIWDWKSFHSWPSHDERTYNLSRRQRGVSCDQTVFAYHLDQNLCETIGAADQTLTNKAFSAWKQRVGGTEALRAVFSGALENGRLPGLWNVSYRRSNIAQHIQPIATGR